MNSWRKLISALIGVLISVGSVHADMVSVYKLDARLQQPQCVYSKTSHQFKSSSNSLNFTNVTDLGLWSVQFLPEESTEIGQITGIENSIDLTGGPSSVSLCLYALMGLGLCSTPHWIKRLHVGHIPEWYHNGGPIQIGHSLAISPESLCSVPVHCFIQPVLAAERLIPKYRLRTVVSLWRKSQFTPEKIASRGPPIS